MTVIVDAHQHFWNYGTYQTSWMEKPPYAGDPTFASIRRSFGPDDLQPELKAADPSPVAALGVAAQECGHCHPTQASLCALAMADGLDGSRFDAHVG